jgi:HK97 family phage prohead protease/HK97 family phage major capsid protein
MSEEIYSREADQIEIRSAEERIIEFRAVPYMTPTDVGGFKEQFARTAFDGVKPENVKLYWRHGEPVGRILQLRSKADGLYGTAKFSDTTAGRDAWTLAKDGVEQGVSVGFRAVEDSWSPDRSLVTRVKASLVEISTTDRPAYAGAAVLATREETPIEEKEETPMSDTPVETPATPVVADVKDARVDEVIARMESVETALVTISEKSTAKSAAPLFRSFGDYVQSRVRGDENAEMFYRTIAENTLADNDGVNPETWLTNIYGLVNKGRPVASAFGIAPLPASGMSIHWPTVTSMPVVGEQDPEGEEIASNAFTIEDNSASIKLYAGGGKVTRQLIDRSSPAYVDAIMRAFAAAYGKTTETAFVSAVVAAANSSTGLAANTFAGFLDGITNAAADIYDESSLTADFIVASGDVWRLMASLTAGDGRPALTVTGTGVNVGGTANIASLSGTFAGLPVIYSHAASSGTLLVASSDAAKFHESAGAPLEITSDDASNLKRGIGVYGYGLSVAYQPKAIRSIALD